MNGWTTTHIWIVNGKMVVAYTIEEALSLYRKSTNSEVEVETIQLLKRNAIDDIAIISDK